MSGNAQAATPINANASAQAKAVLNYLAGLGTTQNPKAVVAQMCGHGDEINTTNNSDPMFQNLYNRNVVALATATGKTVGMVGIDYEFEWAFPTNRLFTANTQLKTFWNSGGLVTITWTPANPWTGNWAGDKSSLPASPLQDLLNTSKPVYTTWHNRLSQIADALQDLQNAGVVVIWRPMQEMDLVNGNWYAGQPCADYIAVWMDMYNYFTTTRHLNNLLWTWSPTMEGWNGYAPWGSILYCDIIAPTYYSDNWSAVCAAGSASKTNYDYFSGAGWGNKVFGMGECGPVAGNGQFNNLDYTNTIQARMPLTKFFQAWTDWDSPTNHYCTIRYNLNATAMMTAAQTITLDKLTWQASLPTGTPVLIPTTGKPTYQSSYYTDGYGTQYLGSLAFDGNANSYWNSALGAANPQWITVDLGASYKVSQVNVNWTGGSYASSFQIQVSANNSSWTTVYTSTSGTGGSSACTFTTATGRYVRVNCTAGPGGYYGYGINDVSVFGIPATAELACNQGRTTYQSSYYTDGYGTQYKAALAFDASTTTYWNSVLGGANPQWITVDLGSSRTISQAIVNWTGGSYASSFQIQVSANNSSWTTVYSTTSGVAGISTCNFTATAGRYVRLNCTAGPAGYYGYGVNQMQVFGY